MTKGDGLINSVQRFNCTSMHMHYNKANVMYTYRIYVVRRLVNPNEFLVSCGIPGTSGAVQNSEKHIQSENFPPSVGYLDSEKYSIVKKGTSTCPTFLSYVSSFAAEPV